MKVIPSNSGEDTQVVIDLLLHRANRKGPVGMSHWGVAHTCPQTWENWTLEIRPN